MLATKSKLSSLDQLIIIMKISTILITTFIFGGLGNLSQESFTQVNTLTMPQQDRLYLLLYDLGCLMCSDKPHWIQTYSNK